MVTGARPFAESVTSQRGVRFAHPRIVIGVPAYDEARFIARTLESIRAQTYRDFLVVISDNASTDGTAGICEAFCRADGRFRLVRQPENLGSAENCNFLLESTRSPYFMWMGAHDLLDPGFLAHHLAALDTRPECMLSCSMTQWIDEAGAPTYIRPPGRLDALRGNRWRRYFDCIRTLGDCTAVNQPIRRSALESFRFERCASADHVLLARLLFMGPVAYTSDPLYLRRAFRSRPAGFEDYVERITGQRSRTRPTDGRATLDAHLRDLERLPASWLKRSMARPVATTLLKYRFAGGPWAALRDRRAWLRWATQRSQPPAAA
jgi:O-antigen biosynthesis protein